MTDARTARPVVELDDLDTKIIRSLNKNARKSFRDIARELEVSLSTVSNRIRRLEGEGVIKGYVPVVDGSRIGYDLVVIVGVRIAHGKLMDVQQRIARNPHVFGVYDVTGEWDSMVIARFRDRDELNEFIKDMLAMEHVERSNTQLVLNTVKEERRVVL
ncbi:MAG TPA: Lrp/AsnC family transcriptional regulator [Candidatus Thermoplasmatota archaeon]|nr:Lrp/AsnC family transcriptional regulator [Candidatus Thermoplasmatota archaeon]